MYAIIALGGKQYKVEEGSELLVEKVYDEIDKQYSIKPLMVGGGEQGIDISDKTEVKFTVLDDVKGPKVIAFKYKPKKGYKRKIGHRQQLVKIRIDSIKAGKATVKKAKTEEKEAVS